MQNAKIKVERETYEKNGKTFYSYFIKGNVRGRDVKASLAPPDKGGYVILDIVFNDAMEAELVVVPYEIRDEKGNVLKGNTYAVRSQDENGDIYECKIKPARDSDKNILNMLLR